MQTVRDRLLGRPEATVGADRDAWSHFYDPGAVRGGRKGSRRVRVRHFEATSVPLAGDALLPEPAEKNCRDYGRAHWQCASQGESPRPVCSFAARGSVGASTLAA
jgi:hypothetical protein